MSPMTHLRLGAVAILGTSALVVACSSSKSDPTPAPPTLSTAAAVSGAADTHCAGKPVVVASQAACHVDAAAPADTDAGDTDGGAPKSDFGDTLYNSEGDDDDCKYHVKW